MAVSDGAPRLVSAADDGFHPPDESRWFHETCWFWFFVPERALGGWLYSWVRPNIGVSGGGCWVWDETTFLHWEAPYFAGYQNLRLPEPAAPGVMDFPNGMRVEALDPLRRYRLHYADGDAIALDLRFDAVMDPWVRVAPDTDPPHANHFDQLGHVTGDLVLHGERMTVDCLAIRDRTWAPRSERWRDGGGYGYTNAATSPSLAFLAVGDHEQVGGYLVVDGTRSPIASGRRAVERDPDHGYVTRVIVEATDTDRRALMAEGTSVSRLALPVPGVHGVVWTSLVQWTLNGEPAWGEDQEPWPIRSWARQRATARRG